MVKMVSLALKALMGNTTRSLHVIASTALCTLIVFSSFSVAEGLLQRLEEVAEGYTATDLFIVMEGGKSISESILPEGFKVDHPNIAAASPIILVEARLCLSEGELPVEVWGVDLPSFSRVRRIYIRGSSFGLHGEALIGASLARKLNLGIGYDLQLSTASARVRVLITGIVETKGPYDDGVVVSIPTARYLRPDMASSYSIIEFRVRDLDAFDSTLREVAEGLKGVEVYPGLGAGRLLTLLRGDITRNLFILSSVIFALSLIAVCHSMVLVVEESEWELRVLRALGATRVFLVKVVLLDSLILCLLGGLFGLALGALASNGVSIALSIVYGVGYLPPKFIPGIALACLLLSLLSGLAAGAAATQRAVRRAGTL